MSDKPKRSKRRAVTWWETELQRFAAEGTTSSKTQSAVLQAVDRLAVLEASNDTMKRTIDQMIAARTQVGVRATINAGEPRAAELMLRDTGPIGQIQPDRDPNEDGLGGQAAS